MGAPLSLAAWLRGLRKTAGLTQGQLALRIAVHRVSVSRWENDETYPPREIRERLNDVAREFEYPPLIPRWRR